MRKFYLVLISYLLCNYSNAQLLTKPTGIYFNQGNITEFTITNALKKSKLVKPYSQQDWELNLQVVNNHNAYLDSRVSDLRMQRGVLATQWQQINTNQDVNGLQRLLNAKRDSLNKLVPYTQKSIEKISVRANFIIVIRSQANLKSTPEFVQASKQELTKLAIKELNEGLIQSTAEFESGLLTQSQLSNMLSGKLTQAITPFYASLSANKKLFVFGNLVEVNPFKLDTQKLANKMPAQQVVLCINMMQGEGKVKSELKRIGLLDTEINKLYQAYTKSALAANAFEHNQINQQSFQQMNVSAKKNQERLEIEIIEIEERIIGFKNAMQEVLLSFDMPEDTSYSKYVVGNVSRLIQDKMKQYEDSIYYYVGKKFESFDTKVNQTGSISMDIARASISGINQLRMRSTVIAYPNFTSAQVEMPADTSKANVVIFTREVNEVYMMPIQSANNEFRTGLIAQYNITNIRTHATADSAGCKGCSEAEKKLAEEIAASMVNISGGTFRMGCDSIDVTCDMDEKPNHGVTLSDFMMSKYEITQRQWEIIMNTKPSDFKSCPDCPIEQVSWEDAQAFIKKLNKLTGSKYRLPTEAEWEYAARAGNSFIYSGSKNLKELAWFGDNSGNQTHAIGLLKPNAFGLYDMSGNVWEWCNDWYGPYPKYDQVDPLGPNNGLYRVIRGGSWNSKSKNCRVSARYNNAQINRYYNLGFRLAHSK